MGTVDQKGGFLKGKRMGGGKSCYTMEPSGKKRNGFTKCIRGKGVGQFLSVLETRNSRHRIGFQIGEGRNEG